MSNDNARDNLVSGDIVKTMLSLSIPAILGMVVIGLYNFMDAVFVGRMVGPEAMTAVKVSYPFTLLRNQLRGKSYDRVRSFNKAFMIAATLLAAVFYVPVMIAPKAMLSMFITDQSIVAAGAPMLRVLFASYITYGVLILAITFFQAIGKAGNAAVLTVLRQALLFLPLVLILPMMFTNSVEGVFYAQLITDAAVLVLAVILMAGAFKSIRREERLALA